MFMNNMAQFGGVMDLEHVIGTVIIASSNMTQNLASNSKNIDFNINVFLSFLI